MNDLLSNSSSHHQEGEQQQSMNGSVEMATMTGVNLDKFFKNVEGIKDELGEIEKIHQRLQVSNESSKTLHSSKAIKDLRSRMDTDVNHALKRAKAIKARLAALERDNVANWTHPGCGPGSSTDRTRTSIVSSLRKKLVEAMEKFSMLREKVAAEHKETVERRYYTITGEKPSEQTVEILISTGESETFLQKAIQEQGRGQVLDTIAEIQERHDAAKEMERSLLDLHQIFLDMSVVVQEQGEQLDDVESQVARANSYIGAGTRQLQVAKKHQRNTRKWTLFAVILLLLIILIIVLPIVLRN